MKRIFTALAWLLFNCTAIAGDLAHFQTWLLPDESPMELVKAFVQADRDGLQTSGQYWPLVQRFTDWVDAPGYDEALVVAGYSLGKPQIQESTASIPVTYYVLCSLYQTSDQRCKSGICHRLDAPASPLQSYTYELARFGNRWVITGSPSGPRIGPHLAMTLITENRDSCQNGKCETDPAAQALQKSFSKASKSFKGVLFEYP